MKRQDGSVAAGIPTLTEVQRELKLLANPADAVFLMRFFKTSPGSYGEGDRFLGVRVPMIRQLVRRYRALPLTSVLELLHSPWHEARLLALLLLVARYQQGKASERETIFQSYLDNTRYINNWDLVDLSAAHIVGAHVTPDDLSLLEQLAGSELLWDRRIAMLATWYWIRRGCFEPALHLAELLLADRHDLMHKVCGWMLREVGKRDQACLEAFLSLHLSEMPRTMLRYAIERFPEPLRQQYLTAAHGKTSAIREPLAARRVYPGGGNVELEGLHRAVPQLPSPPTQGRRDR